MRRALGVGVVCVYCVLWAVSAHGQVDASRVHLRLLRDPEDILSIDDARNLADSDAFTAIDGSTASVGKMAGTVWVEVTVDGLEPNEDYILELSSPRLSYVDFYDDEAAPLKSGAGYPFAVRPIAWLMPAFPITTEDGTKKTVFLRIRETGVVQPEVRVWTWHAFGQYSVSYVWSRASTAGALFLLLCSNLGIFLVLRERGHLGIALYLAMFFLFYAAHQGLGPFAFWPNWPWLGTRSTSFFGTLCLMAGMAMMHTLLELRRTSPWLRRVSWLWVLFLGFVALCVMVTDSTWRLLAVEFSTTFTPVMLTILGLFAFLYSSHRRDLYLRVYSGVSVCGFVFILSYLGFLPSSWPAVQLLSMVIILACLVWTLDVAHRLKAREAESREQLAALAAERSARLEDARKEVEALEKLLPICSNCKKIRDDSGKWQPVENYLCHSERLSLSHGICPECMAKLYPEYN